MVILQQQIDAAVLLAIFHLGAQPGIARQGGQRRLLDQLAGYLVGAGGVDADEVPRRALGDLPAVGQLALGIVGGGVPDPGARLGATGHGPGIGAVDGDLLAIVQQHVGQEALVAGDQQAGLQRGIENHGALSFLNCLLFVSLGEQPAGWVAKGMAHQARSSRVSALARARRGQQASGW
ncbi:hypothetical protein D3C80_1395500 [compost metagenome]